MCELNLKVATYGVRRKVYIPTEKPFRAFGRFARLGEFKMCSTEQNYRAVWFQWKPDGW